MTKLVGDSKNMATMGETPARKVNKQIMERKRRVRINSCLSELKLLVLQAMKKDTSQFSKMEKADILDMTVEYLRCLQKRHYMLSAANNPSSVSTYRAGFNQCASEILRYCGDQSLMNEDVRVKMMDYLSDCLQTVNVNSGRNSSKVDNKATSQSQTNTVLQTPDSPMSQSSASSSYDSQSCPSPSYSSEQSCTSPTPEGAFSTAQPQPQFQTVPGVYVNVPVVYQVQVPEPVRGAQTNQDLYPRVDNLVSENGASVQNVQPMDYHHDRLQAPSVPNHNDRVMDTYVSSQQNLYSYNTPTKQHQSHFHVPNSSVDMNNNTVEYGLKPSHSNYEMDTSSQSFKQSQGQFSLPVPSSGSELMWRPW